MAPTASLTTMTVDAVLRALIDLSTPFTPPSTGALSDDQLLSHQRTLAEVERRLTATSAALAAEVGHRSRPELGHDGLAARLGARTPQKLVQAMTGATKARAATLVRIGSLLPTAPPPPEPSPWMVDVAVALAAGDLSLEAADAIRLGLGDPTDEVPADALALAARTLVLLAPTITVEALAVRAREERLALDLSLVVEREKALREKRSLTVHRQADGMTRLVALLDPESAAMVSSVFDAITSPRRGGPRFVDETTAARATAIVDDSRTTEQLALDAFVQLVEMGSAVAPTAFIGTQKPAVKVLVTGDDLRTRAGLGFIEGQTEPVSIATVERHVCTDGTIPILFDGHAQVINLGREQRLFSRHQRVAMAARDGGCLWPDCERPPSWCEAHHTHHWQRDRGHTNIDLGVLLCKHHHLLVHDHHWEIERRDGQYWLIPPPDIDLARTPIPLPSKSAATRRLAAQAV